MSKKLVIGKTRTNQPVEYSPMFEQAIIAMVKYALEHGEDLDAVLKSITTSGNATIGGNLSVTGSINGEVNPSVKPIYYHPVYLNGSLVTGEIVRILCVILDNSETAYTIPTAIAKIKQIMDLGGIISVDGIVVDTNNKTDSVYMIRKNDTDYKLYHFNYDTRDEIDIDDITWDTCYDGVNKIN